jgi:hypothetical protein
LSNLFIYRKGVDMTVHQRNRWLAAAVAALALTACGGNSGDGYGSIAVSASATRVAIVTGGLTQSIANDRARDKCDANDCVVVEQFEQCGAAAAAPIASGAVVIGTGVGGTAFDAQTVANQACTAKGGVGCGPIPNLPAQCN